MDKQPDPPGLKMQVESVTGEKDEPQEVRASHTAASQTESWQLVPGERQV